MIQVKKTVAESCSNTKTEYLANPSDLAVSKVHDASRAVITHSLIVLQEKEKIASI